MIVWSSEHNNKKFKETQQTLWLKFYVYYTCEIILNDFKCKKIGYYYVIDWLFVLVFFLHLPQQLCSVVSTSANKRDRDKEFRFKIINKIHGGIYILFYFIFSLVHINLFIQLNFALAMRNRMYTNWKIGKYEYQTIYVHKVPKYQVPNSKCVYDSGFCEHVSWLVKGAP